MTTDQPRIQTVIGPIDASAAGVALGHEHVLIDFTVMFKEPESEPERALARQPVRLDNLAWVRRNFSSNRDNLRLQDEDVARDELLLYRAAGGRTVVDPTSRGIARDPVGLARVARASGLHIVMGSGYYVAASHPPDMDARTVDDLTREMVHDLTAGVGENSAPIRARIAERLGWLGAELDPAANAAGATLISAPASKVALYVLPTDEELMIARHTLALIARS